MSKIVSSCNKHKVGADFLFILDLALIYEINGLLCIFSLNCLMVHGFLTDPLTVDRFQLCHMEELPLLKAIPYLLVVEFALT